ncbi:uncharacterized protein LOC9316793 [Arabidopsis lyrata subsp. lyrata]|uniref:uncharacterized protein LOC9316793 n=1 Tax=Arabidopsis lyrata subsp. lyrata TaxID=81972 RepID=UPI000A29B182|nr:uncharacterized protein LOC9316793 [Arabidopsis lyrata subsp. lyrata]XP_020884559.1 uncharacterized protein LOC9316793 [Arabidopsis lyrata subsp. lyrata]|eukprot:XP_020884558.1 uncharacterized protein LOC9316793 [Arabidopsis lyrata subsp. lyrata]
MAASPTSLTEKPLSRKTFDDLEGVFSEEEVLFRLIHFWEARNHTRGNSLIGLELLFIDEKSTTIQAFIPANRISRYEKSLKPNSVYKMKKFIISPCKKLFKVSAHKYGICFTNKTDLDEVTKGEHKIASQKFRIRSFNDFAAIVDRNGDLFDVIGQIRLITGDNLSAATSNAEEPKAANGKSKDKVFMHLLMKDGETVRIYLWDNIAAKFRTRWNASETKPTILLLTTVNAKFLGGAVTLSSTSASRLFFDTDIAETT